MKRVFLLLMSIAFVSVSFAQQVNPYPKTINVNGSAEIEIVPDEIYVQIELGEYEKKGSGKIGLEAIKKKFFEATKAVGIPDSLISIAGYQGQNTVPYWERKKKKTPDMLASISYQVKFKNVKLMDALVEKLDDEATRNFFITKTSHSKIEQFRKELKMEAVKAAKVKAAYLAEAINEKVGVAVTINEPVDFSMQPVFKTMALANTMLERADDGGYAGSDIDFTKIKLKYEVSVVFQIL